jgi:hypothetical protein
MKMLLLILLLYSAVFSNALEVTMEEAEKSEAKASEATEASNEAEATASAE